jgi:hypothetical protein
MTHERRELSSVAIMSIAISLIIFLYFFIYPLYHQYFPKCIFHCLTGLYCPLCGTQRAISAFLHGNILVALEDNLLVIAAIPLVIVPLILLLARALTKKDFNYKAFYSNALLKAVVLIVIIFGILRNISVYPFTLFVPL